MANSSDLARTLDPAFNRAGDVFQVLRDGKPRTRAELASITGLARSTVVARVHALMKAGFVSPVGDAASSGGRPPSRFALSSTGRLTLGIDLGATHGLVAVADLKGTIVAEQRVSLDISMGPVQVLDSVLEVSRRLLRSFAEMDFELVGIGIGLPGPVEHSTGRPTRPPIMPGWDGFDVPNYVRRSFGVPVLIDNDVNLMALGEQVTHWPECKDFLFVKVATGIGMGIISNGALQRGADGSAGDLGHIGVSRASHVLCRCGNVGCLEAVAGGPAIAQALNTQGVDVASNDSMVELGRIGDNRAATALRQAGRDIGEVLAGCVNLLNPSVIVIGGSLAFAGDHILAGIREVVYKRSLPLATAHLTVVKSQSGERSGVLGAVRMVVEQVLAPAAIEEALARADDAGLHLA